MKKLQRGLTLITALAIVAIFLAVALMMLELATHNSQNVGAGYTKQQYFDVAEAGIDRGLTDIDSNLPAPGSTSPSLTPPTPPPTPSGDQTALPSIPGVLYHYSYWHNPNAQPTSTPDPLHARGFEGAGSTIVVPAYGTLVWSYSISTHDGQPTGRDVGVETVATVFTSMHNTCAVCAGGNISIQGSSKGSPPPECIQNGVTMRICTDPSPSPTPSFVPINLGGSYTYTGNCSTPCAFGDGTATPNPNNIVQGANPGQFLDPQSTIDELSNASMWQALSQTSTNVFYTDCATACGTSSISNLNGKAGLLAGQTAFFNGSLALASGSANYAGLMIVNGCMTMSGKAQLNGGQTGETIVLGTDAQCGGNAFSTSGNPNWLGGTLYTAQGSVSLSGTGSTKFEVFYGDIISAGNVTLGGNGTIGYQNVVQSQQAFLGQYAVDSFLQY